MKPTESQLRTVARWLIRSSESTGSPKPPEAALKAVSEWLSETLSQQRWRRRTPVDLRHIPEHLF